MRRGLQVGFLAIVWAVIGGLGLSAGAPDALAQGAKAEFSWPRYFNVITPAVGTANHSLAVAWTSEFGADTGVRARVLPAPTGYARAEWLNTGEGRLCLFQASDYFDQLDAVEGYASRTGGPSDHRVVYVNMVTPWGYMVRGDSKIKTIEDIKPGTRVSFYSGSSFIAAGVDALLAYAGLTREDVELVEVGSYGANTSVVVEGRAEVTFTSPLSGPSYQAEAAPNGIRWLAIPPPEENREAYDRYRAVHPGYMLMETRSGVKSAIGVQMDHAYQTNNALASEDPEFVRALAVWLDENHDKFKEKFTHAPMMNVDNLVAFLDSGHLMPLHEGTIAFLKDKGLWKPEYQARQDKLVALAKNRVEVYEAALDAATDKGLSTVPGNKDWVSFWEDYRKQNGITQSMGEAVRGLGAM